MASLDDFLGKLSQFGVFKIGMENEGGDFELQGGALSPIYIDLRELVSEPQLLSDAAKQLSSLIDAHSLQYDYLVGVPYAAMPVATLLSYFNNKPMLLQRKAAKQYGTRKRIEGKFESGKRALIIEDVVVSGASILDTVKVLREEGLIVEEVLCILNREQGGADKLKEAGVTLHSVLTMTELLDYLSTTAGQITEAQREKIAELLKNPMFAKREAKAQESGISKLLQHIGLGKK